MDATTVIADDSLDLASKCWDWLADRIRSHRAGSDRPFSIALAGGNTPRQLYSLAANGSPGARVDWTRVMLLWGDERNVPTDHADSNYRMVAESLLNQTMIPPENVLIIPEPGGDPKLAAEKYERLLYQRLATSDDGFPVVDCILLGLGEDVHTASLFPGSQGLEERDRAVIANYVEKLNSWRITLTIPTINAARSIAFLISGKSKHHALETLWNGPRDGRQYPAQLVNPKDGKLIYFVDKAALGALIAI